MGVYVVVDSVAAFNQVRDDFVLSGSHVFIEYAHAVEYVESLPKDKQGALIMVLNGGNVRIPFRERGRQVARRVRDEWPKTDCENLFYAIFNQAVVDFTSPTANPLDKEGARVYLQGEIPHAEICGVNSEWIARVFKETGIDLTN